jgi:hypothetical protein
MPTYFFHLRTADGTIGDQEGTDLDDDWSAQEHARTVARELMRNRESLTRSWRLEVRNRTGRQCFDLLFATVDDSIDDFERERRSTIRELHRQSASLFEEMRATRLALRRLKGTIRRWEGIPYTAAQDGMTVDDMLLTTGSDAITTTVGGGGASSNRRGVA